MFGATPRCPPTNIEHFICAPPSANWIRRARFQTTGSGLSTCDELRGRETPCRLTSDFSCCKGFNYKKKMEKEQDLAVAAETMICYQGRLAISDRGFDRRMQLQANHSTIALD